MSNDGLQLGLRRRDLLGILAAPHQHHQGQHQASAAAGHNGFLGVTESTVLM